MKVLEVTPEVGEVMSTPTKGKHVEKKKTTLEFTKYQNKVKKY